MPHSIFLQKILLSIFDLPETYLEHIAFLIGSGDEDYDGTGPRIEGALDHEKWGNGDDGTTEDIPVLA